VIVFCGLKFRRHDDVNRLLFSPWPLSCLLSLLNRELLSPSVKLLLLTELVTLEWLLKLLR